MSKEYLDKIKKGKQTIWRTANYKFGFDPGKKQDSTALAIYHKGELIGFLHDIAVDAVLELLKEYGESEYERGYEDGGRRIINIISMAQGRIFPKALQKAASRVLQFLDDSVDLEQLKN